MYTPLNQYHVVMEVAPKYWQSPEGLNNIYIPTANGGVVPLSAIAKFQETTAPLSVNHQGQYPSVTVSFNLSPGVALSDAARTILDMEQRVGMPATIHGMFSGTLQAFQSSLSTQPMLIITALMAVYIVLGILYESFIHPITILSTLPSAGVGAVLALMIFKMDLSVIALIGIILLIGIVKKNAIMMIDFALAAERHRGQDVRGSHLSGVPAALPADSDDDDGGSLRRVAAGPGYGNRIGIAAATRRYNHRRLDREPDAHALHHARGLSLSRPHAPPLGEETQETRRCPRGRKRSWDDTGA